MNIQPEKALRLARTLFVLVFTLFISVSLADGQRKTPGGRRTPQPVKTRPLPPRQVAAANASVITQISLPELVQRVKPSVVLIRVFDKDGKVAKEGSAFFITPTRVVTNYHVIEGGNSAEIYSNEGFTYSASRILSYDSNTDLAIIEIELPAGVQFKPLTIARNGVREGESIVVIGNPQGLRGTVSQGIVSAVRQAEKQQSYVQITAPISQGSSGGPVMNMRGEVIGIATFQLNQGQNLNFAISSSALGALSENAERLSKAVRFYEDGVRLYRGGNHRRALEMFAQAVKIIPDYAAAWLAAGNAYLALGETADALSAFGEVTRLEPNNAQAYFNSGVAYAKQGRHADAVNCFRRVLVIYPNSVETYVETGNAYFELKDIRGAIDSYKQAIRLRPDDPNANYNLGLAYLARGERKSARKQVKKLRELGASEFADELSQQIPR
ncbi:MAG TPA: tetratricopeptide repeat protein [Pyrinomonadaceae bacterium]|jgi:tetratricopeptide (TPR) repeat protein